MSGKAVIIRSDARNLPLPDASVDLIVTSPPYFGLRSYRDNGEHYEGQVGSEATPQEFLQALWGCMQEWWRVLKPEGSCFVNLGDKRSGSGGHNNAGVSSKSTLKHDGRENPKPQTERELTLRALSKATRRNAPDRYNQASFGRTKSKMLIPHRFAIGCEDGLADPEGIGWVMRQDLIWQKLNGLPESVTDRHRDSHEYIFHFTKQGRYFAAMDEIRQPHARDWAGETGLLGTTEWSNGAGRNDANRVGPPQPNPLGKLPGSVWPMASEPLLIPQWAKDKYGLGDHFACVDTETEVLTEHGWLRHDEVRIGDQVAGYNLDLGIAEWTTCHGVHRYDFDGEMVAVDKRDLSMRLTTNHRQVVQKQLHNKTRGPVHVVDAGELKPSHFILRSAEWGQFESKSIGPDLAALCGWVASEGWYQNDSVSLSQSSTANPHKVEEIDALLGRFPDRLAERYGRKTYRVAMGFLRRREAQRTYRGQEWTDVSWRLPLWLSAEVQDLMPDKLLPWSFVGLPEDERRAVLDAFIAGDGHRRVDGRTGIFQKVRHNLDVLQAIAVTLGYKTTLRRGTDKWTLFLTLGGRSITLRGTAGTTKPIPREHYKGIVWCPTTGTGTWFARRNGSVFITGNSFPTELPRKLILGFSPSGICVECGEPRRPVVDKQNELLHVQGNHGAGKQDQHGNNRLTEVRQVSRTEATITSYACACTPFTDHPGTASNRTVNDPTKQQGTSWENPGGGLANNPRNGPWREYHLKGWTPPATTPAVVLDPFGGTGTVAMVAKGLGRIGISNDLSQDYCNLARWRIEESGHGKKAEQRTWRERQETFL